MVSCSTLLCSMTRTYVSVSTMMHVNVEFFTHCNRIYIFPTIISGIMRLDARARQDVAILGSEFLKLDGIISLF